MYSRLSFAGQPLDLSRQGAHIVGSVRLNGARDFRIERPEDRHLVTLEVNFDCGTMLR